MIGLLDLAIRDLHDARLAWQRGLATDALARIVSAARTLKDAARIGVEGALS